MSLHGVTQTDGIGKTAFDPGMFWLDPDMVPTMGDYFRAAGYRTHCRPGEGATINSSLADARDEAVSAR